MRKNDVQASPEIVYPLSLVMLLCPCVLADTNTKKNTTAVFFLKDRIIGIFGIS